MSQGQVDAQTIEQTKQQIRGLVQQIAQLSRSDIDAEQFYSEVLHKIVTALAAQGGAVWTITPDKRLKLDYQINLDRGLLNTESEEAQKHLRLLQSIIQSGDARLAPPMSGGEEPNAPGNPTNNLLVLAPMQTDDSVEGVLEIFQRPDSQPASQQGYLRFLVQMSQLVGDWLKNRKLRTFSDRQSLWAEIDRFAKEAHNSLDLKETAYTIANEGRRLIGCDRLSVAVKHGIKHKIEAVSGQDTLDTRSNVVVMLRKLTDRVCAAGDPLWYNGTPQDLPPQIEKALSEYIDESHTKALAVVPIRQHEQSDDPDELGQEDTVAEAATGEVIGALIVEQIDAPQSRDSLSPKVDLVTQHSSLALSNSLEHNNLFLMPVWKTLGQARLLVKAKTLPKTLFFSTLILAALLSMLMPWNFRLKALGTLEPVERAQVFIGAEGQVEERKVQHQSKVEKGELLLTLASPMLDQQFAKLSGDLATNTKRLRALRDQISQAENSRDRDRRAQANDPADILAQINQVEAEMDSLEVQLNTVRQQKDMLRVESPIAGEVVTWDLKRALPEGRPLAAGQRVMTIANTDPEGEWELVVFLPESDLGHLLRHHFPDDQNAPTEEKLLEKKIDVTYVVHNQPSRQLHGRVKAIQRSAELIEEKGVCYRMLVEVNIDENGKRQLDLEAPNPGSEVIARVHCGKRMLGYVLFHKAWEWLQLNALF